MNSTTPDSDEALAALIFEIRAKAALAFRKAKDQHGRRVYYGSLYPFGLAA